LTCRAFFFPHPPPGSPVAVNVHSMLRMCSGFVNYLVEKARKKGLLPT
jgi:hypothetical protein